MVLINMHLLEIYFVTVSLELSQVVTISKKGADTSVLI